MLIQRVQDVVMIPQLLDELPMLSAQAEDGKWVEIIEDEPPTFRLQFKEGLRCPPFIAAMITRLREVAGGGLNANDWCGMLATSQWLRNGCMVVWPTPEQAEAFEHVDVNLELIDYQQPYPAVVCEVPHCPGRKFKYVTCHHHSPEILCLVIGSFTGDDDITTMIRHRKGHPIDEYLQIVDDSVGDLIQWSLRAQRIALNMMLALTNWGYKDELAYPKAYRNDEWMAKEDSERGRKARARLRTHLRRVSFNHEVIVRRPAPKPESSTPTGKTVAPHWVRGHWKMQPHGPQNSLRKRAFVAPYLVHPDLYQPGTNLTVYKDYRP